jgi:hypothetical protein
MAAPAKVAEKTQMRLRFPAKCFSDSEPGDDLHRIVTSSESGSYARQAESDRGPVPPVSEPTRARGYDPLKKKPSPSRPNDQIICLQLWLEENARQGKAALYILHPDRAGDLPVPVSANALQGEFYPHAGSPVLLQNKELQNAQLPGRREPKSPARTLQI